MQIRGLMIDPRHQHAHRRPEGCRQRHRAAHLGRHLRGERDCAGAGKDRHAAPHDPRPDAQPDPRPERDVVRKVVVSELREDTFYAVIWMEQDGETVAIDSRPSRRHRPGAALGLPHLRQPRRARQRPAGQPKARRTSTADEMRRWLENLNDDEMGRYKM